MALAATFSVHGRLQNQSPHGARCAPRTTKKIAREEDPEETEEDDLSIHRKKIPSLPLHFQTGEFTTLSGRR
jgi:hypothetical protein